jgi:RND family efflux transporter MFP subunit
MSRKLKAMIILMVMLAGVVGLISGCSKPAEVSEIQEDGKYTPVEIEKATIETIENKISINGKVTANEEITVIPKAVGIVTSVNVKLGDIVQEGSVLFTIEQQDVLKSVEQAANAIEFANKGVAQAENGLNTASINYELNKEKIENAQLNLERTKKLYEEGAVSKSQLEQAELAASEKSLDAVKGQVSQAEISYQQALNQLRQAEISYEQASSGLNNTVVKAPMTGVISSLNVKEGQIATNSQAAATIVEMDQVYIQVNVVENIVNRLQIGQEVEVNVPAAFNEYITSTISYISPTADPRSQLYAVKVYIDNSDKKIRPGMNGEMKVGLDTVGSAIIVKGNAVLDKDGQKVVYVVENNIAVEKLVTTGLDTGDYVEIKEGIKEGDKVIVEGQHYVEDGKTVKVVRGE